MSTDAIPDWRRMATDLAIPAFLVVAGWSAGVRDVLAWIVLFSVAASGAALQVLAPHR